MSRIVVIGASGSGKITFSRSLAKRLGVESIELDQLYWLPNWTVRPEAEFCELVGKAALLDTWVADGNYSIVRDILWSRATTIIWLNYPFGLVLYRSIMRSLKRAVTKEKLFAGNVESFRKTFLSRDSIILWVLKTYHQKRKSYPELLDRQAGRGVPIFEFNPPPAN